MGLLGNFDDPAVQAQLAMGAGLLGGGSFGQALSRGLLGSQQVLGAAEDRKSKAAYMQSQIEERAANAAKDRAAIEAQARQQEALAGAFGQQGGAPGIPGVPGSAGTIDIQRLVQAGIDPVKIAQYAQLRNANRDKVARTVEGMDAQGRPVTTQYDEYGSAVGTPMQQWKAPVSVNQGNQTTFLDPVTLQPRQSLQTFQSPESIASNAVSMRGQNMTDARAREFNAVTMDANNIKRSEKQAEQDLTKNSQIASFDTMLGTLDRLSKHPGLSNSVGLVGALPTIPGSKSANFQAELNTFQSQAFLPMVAQLKGMGALSDAEGKKLTAAVGALDPKMGEQAFRESVSRITADMDAARTRMLGGAGAATRNPSSPKGAPAPGQVVDGYRFKGGNPASQSSWEKQ